MILEHLSVLRDDEDDSSILFYLEGPTPQDWIDKAKILSEQGVVTAHVYVCDEDVELLDDDFIPKTTTGNLGPHGDMVYFHTHAGDTACIMLEFILVNDTIFRPIMLDKSPPIS